MTPTAHVAAREAVYHILHEVVRLGLELRPKMLRSRAALPHERIYESFVPLRHVKELQRRRIALDTANTCAPSTPEHAIRHWISHLMRDISCLMRDISSCTSRARASFTSCPRALGCTDVYGFGIVPADLGTAPPDGQRLPHPNFTAPRGDAATMALEQHCPGLCALQAVTTMLLQAAGVLSPPLLHRPSQAG